MSNENGGFISLPEESVETESDSAPIEESAEESVETAPESVEAAVEEAVANGASKKEVQNLKRMLSLKVNGKTIEKEFDFGDEKAMQKELQMAAAGREAMETKAEYEKALTTLVERLKTDPLALAEELGLDADEFAAIRLQKRLDEAKKSPEQIESEKMRKELEAYRKQIQDHEEQTRSLQERKIQEDAVRELDDEIDTALQAYTTLPKGSPLVMDLIAKNLNWAMDNFERFGYAKAEDVKVADVLPSVESDLKRHMNKFFEGVPLDLVQQYIGQKATENLRQQRITAAKKVNNVNNITKTNATQTAEKKKEAPKMNIKDFMRSNF